MTKNKTKNNRRKSGTRSRSKSSSRSSSRSRSKSPETKVQDLVKDLRPVEREGYGYKFKIGNQYFFDNEDNGNLLTYTMESGIFQGAKDYREPNFNNVKLLLKREEPGFYDWENYHKDKGVRPTAIFRFYEIKPEVAKKNISKILTKGKIHGLETNSLLADSVFSYLHK